MPTSSFGMSTLDVPTVETARNSYREAVTSLLLAAAEQSDRLVDLEANSPLLASRSCEVILNLKRVIEQEQRLLKSLLEVQS